MKKLSFQNYFCKKFLIASILAIIVALFSLSIYAENALNQYYVVINNKKIMLDIADTPASRQQGLMFVESMNEDNGMLFILDKKVFVSFWMKNMKIPLDILFISGEKIAKIYSNVPVCKNAPCDIYPSDHMVDYVLEVNAGFCDKYKIRSGQSIKLSPDVLNRISKLRRNYN